MIFKNILALIIAQLISLGVLANDFVNSTHSLENGFPSNEVYYAVKDSAGYMWFSTDKGIVRYNGQEYRHYGLSQGLNSTVIYKLISFENGSVAFYGSKNKVGIIRNDSIFYVEQKSSSEIATIYNDNEHLLVTYRSPASYEVFSSKTGKLLKTEQLGTGIFLKSFDNSKLAFIGSRSKHNSITVITANTRFTMPLPRLTHKNVGCLQVNNNYVIASGKSLVVFNKNGIVKQIQLPTNATSYLKLVKDEIWVGLFNKGWLQISATDFNVIEHNNINLSVSDIFIDNNETVWICTLESGVIQKRKTDFITLHYGRALHMILFQNSLWFSNFKGTIFELDLTTFEVNKLMELQQLFLMKSYTNNVLLSDLNQSSDLSTHLPVDLIPAYGHFSKFGNVYYGVLYSRLMIWNKESIPTEIHTNLARSYTYFTKNLNGDLYLGRSHGLFKVNIKDSTFSEEKLLSYPTTCLLPYKDGYFIGTKGNGVFYVDSSNSTVLGKPKIDGEYVEHLSLKKDTLIVVTNTGINLIVQNSKESDNQKLFHLGLSDGLASLAIKSIVIHREYLYLASDKGLQRIKLSHITKPKPNPIPIIERLNSHKIRTKQLYTLGPGTKNIRVELNTVDFNSIGDQNLEYRLLGQSDSTWQNSSAKTLEFINLQPGSYQLEVRSKYADNGPTITNVQFKLLPFFYQTTAFKVVLIVFTLLLALGIYMYEQQRIRKKNEAIVLLEQLRFKALTAQLNPHFIFNVLNSIQALILTDQNDQAAENLAEFSDLISKTLMNTNEMFIPLNDEIDFINQYVKVERSRFEHDIEFEWKIDSTITPRMVMVPTMFLQPYIENAIVHGLKNISYTGKIRVKIQKLPTRDFKVFIEDNGIGLRAALKRKNKNRRPSLAMKNLNERFNTLERMFNHKFSHTIEEITDNNVVKGTLVQITIPYKVKEI